MAAMNFTGGATRTTSAGPASDHHATTTTALNYLARRGVGIEAVETPYATRYDGAPECRSAIQDFLAGLLLPSQGAPDAAAVAVAPSLTIDHCYVTLVKVLDATYSGERSFSGALFRAVGEGIRQAAASSPPAGDGGDDGSSRHRRSWLGRQLGGQLRTPRRLRVLVTEQRIVLDRIVANPSADGYEFAVGLAREGAFHLEEPGSCLLRCKAQLDHHALVLWVRRAGGTDRDWVVWRALAVVGLKAGESVCALTRSAGGGDGGLGNVSVSAEQGVLDPLRVDGNGPLAQAIMSTLAHVLPGIASLGELPPAIPLALVACKTAASKGPLRQGWVHGNLLTPRLCGDGYSYSVDAYGDILQEKGANHSPVAAYVDVLTRGLGAANRFLDRLAADHALPAPHPISGRELRFGMSTVPAEPPQNLLTDVELVATPVSAYGIEPRARTAHPHYRIYQGEMFQATVSVQALRSANISTARHKVFWCRDTSPSTSVPVLIKVSSDSCFDLLIPSGAAFLRHLKERPWNADGAVREALSQSLLGVYVTPDRSGLVQLLPNLQSEYTALSPRDWLQANGGDALWRAFAGLVREVLLPLAGSDEQIVHCDVRAGYDVTSNIMCNAARGSMRLIDLDSLCEFGRLEKLSGVIDLKNILAKKLPDPLKSAMGFVLGQVICAAEVWLEGTLHSEVKANATIHRGWQSLTEGADPVVAVDGAAAAGGVDEALVAKVLDHYQETFGRTSPARTS
jgi:hypothetical protein